MSAFVLKLIKPICSFLSYHQQASPPSDRQAAERPAIAGICEKSRFRYGYRRVAAALRKAAGFRIADKTALKVCFVKLI